MSDALAETRQSPVQALTRVCRLLTDAQGPDEALALLVDAAAERLGAGGAAALRLTDDGRIAVTAARGLPAGIAGWSTEAEVFGQELGEEFRAACGPRFAHAEVLQLVADGNLYGVLVLLAASPRGLERPELELVQGLVDLAAVAIGKAVQYAKLERAFGELAASREAIVREVNERLRAEEALQREQKLAQERARLADIGAITAKIAHDLGNPLSALSMQAQLIASRARKDPTAALASVLKPAEHLMTEVRRLEGMIREFLSFARGQRLELRVFEVGQLLRDVVELWKPVAEAQSVALVLEEGAALPPIAADVEKLHRVLGNLVKNAIEAIGDGPGEVHLFAAMPNRESVRISIADTGAGMPDTIEPFRLFETTKKDGTGLGLAIAKQIMLAHGGDLSFEPRPPRGTVFHADLPARPLPGAAVA
jgi:signal transduction histidine kinase